MRKAITGHLLCNTRFGGGTGNQVSGVQSDNADTLDFRVTTVVLIGSISPDT